MYAAPLDSGAAGIFPKNDPHICCSKIGLFTTEVVIMKEQTNSIISTSYKEVKIGNTLYRVTSVFTGEKDLGQTLEQLAVRRAMAELTPCPAT